MPGRHYTGKFRIHNQSQPSPLTQIIKLFQNLMWVRRPLWAIISCCHAQELIVLYTACGLVGPPENAGQAFLGPAFAEHTYY